MIVSLRCRNQERPDPERHELPVPDLEVSPLVCFTEEAEGTHLVVARSPLEDPEIRGPGELPVGRMDEVDADEPKPGVRPANAFDVLREPIGEALHVAERDAAGLVVVRLEGPRPDPSRPVDPLDPNRSKERRAADRQRRAPPVDRVASRAPGPRNAPAPRPGSPLAAP